MSKKKKIFGERPVCMAVDPGNVKSAYLLFLPDSDVTGNLTIIESGKVDNAHLLWRLSRWFQQEEPVLQFGTFVIETPRPRGKPTAAEEFETVFWIGRFVQVVAAHAKWSMMFRSQVKMAICGNNTAKDSHIRAALIDLFGGETLAIGGRKCPDCKGKGWRGRDHDICGTCAGDGWEDPPGPLRAISADIWSALAVAVTWTENSTIVQRILPTHKLVKKEDSCPAEKSSPKTQATQRSFTETAS